MPLHSLIIELMGDDGMQFMDKAAVKSNVR